MAISKWQVTDAASRTGVCSLDFVFPAGNYTVFNCGLYYVGGGKAVLRRPLVRYDLLFTAPVVGDPIVGDEVIADAYLEGDCTSVFYGAGAVACTIDRCIRPDWEYTQATWNIYKTANNWTLGGGDTSTPQLSFTSPATTGAFTLAGMLPFVTDALASRNGLVNLRFKIGNEANDGIDKMWTAFINDYTLGYTNTLLLCLDYTPGAAQEPRSVEGGRRKLLSRPDFDPIASRRFDATGQTLREIRQTRERLERGVRV